MNKHLFSVIGCQHAHIATFIQEMLELGHECAGIYEPDQDSIARSIADKFGIPLANSMDDMLAAEIDIVGCAAINSEKIDIVEICERTGKHIMLDKPVVISRDGYRRLEAVSRRGIIQIGMLLTERFNPPIYSLKKQIDRGTLGRIVSIGMRKPHRLMADKRPRWFFSKEQSGGILIDLLIHDFDLLRWLTGREIIGSEGYMSKNMLPEYPAFYDAVGLQVLLEGGIFAQLYADWHTPLKSWTWGDCRIFVVGTEGCAELRLAGDPLVSEQPIYMYVTDGEPPTRVEADMPPLKITEDFLNRVYGKEAILRADDILAAMRATLDADERVKTIDFSTPAQFK
ncbi:Gfo/Idh/MocA family oxidoreductase [Paenibacillus doosanensis]|uniref:Inositol 2-dehydrogenase n=1 Tax=Paenibacillus konkukensis TaxID=2020716 RepID=A0ABY4RPF2_9BACL|nr:MULTISPECIES: Gfo/Idh/MocA family oxidoreductase [Paenibacillus]MCS7461423.1 Gfo/Idh/MocA family oxidoreductase [Paenibacillus doosanensis]UQZ83696.1 Inositol 2-dehydrogenase [Paenibacillus konkukensis]